MAFTHQSSTTTFTYHTDAGKKVRKIAALVQDLVKTGPTEKRLFIWEAFPKDGTLLIPVTFNSDRVAAERMDKIEAGQLADAYRLHLIIGDGHPTEEEAQSYPWWREYYLKMFEENCVQCQMPLLEDRAMSRMCHHQLCTACACNVTEAANEGTYPKCTKCGTSGRFLIFNGEQTHDDRDHTDVVLTWM